MKISTFKFGSEEVCVCIKNQEVWFAAADICRILGYKNPAQAVKDNVSPKYTQRISVSRPGSKPIFISSKGLRMLLAKSKMPQARCLAALHQVEVQTLTYEQNYIGIVMKALERFNPIYQFFVNGYRIDLYFPSQKIAIECDENGHQDRDRKEEQYRQDSITKALGCRFIRFNPHENGFNIGSVIAEILDCLLAEPTNSMSTKRNISIAEVVA